MAGHKNELHKTQLLLFCDFDVTCLSNYFLRIWFLEIDGLRLSNRLKIIFLECVMNTTEIHY